MGIQTPVFYGVFTGNINNGIIKIPIRLSHLDHTWFPNIYSPTGKHARKTTKTRQTGLVYHRGIKDPPANLIPKIEDFGTRPV